MCYAAWYGIHQLQLRASPMSDLVPHPGESPGYRWGIDPAGRVEDDDGGFRPDFILIGYRDATGQFVVVGSDDLSGIKIQVDEPPPPEWPMDIYPCREAPTPQSFTLAGTCKRFSLAMTAAYETSMQALTDLWRRDR